MTPEVIKQGIDNGLLNISDYNAVIVRRKEDGKLSFATFCIKPHWKQEGVMFTSGTWDATKFPLNSEDLGLFYNYLKDNNKDYDIDIVLLLKHIDSKNENWENENTRGDYKNTRVFKGSNLKEIYK